MVCVYYVDGLIDWNGSEIKNIVVMTVIASALPAVSSASYIARPAS